MADCGEARKPIWAKWRVGDDGTVSVVATFAEAEAYVQRELRFDSLDQAAAGLGMGFRDVVLSALEVGSQSGRWRP